MYRDGGNYKQYGEVIFSNDTNLGLSFIDEHIKNHLIDQLFFYPHQLGLKDLRYFPWDSGLDHMFHEYVEIEETAEPAKGTDVAEFLQMAKTKATDPH